MHSVCQVCSRYEPGRAWSDFIAAAPAAALEAGRERFVARCRHRERIAIGALRRSDLAEACRDKVPSHRALTARLPDEIVESSSVLGRARIGRLEHGVWADAFAGRLVIAQRLRHAGDRLEAIGARG